MKEEYKIILRNIRSTLNISCMLAIHRSQLLCRLYYAFFDSSFVGEMRAVVAGKIMYWQQMDRGDAFYVLRRNTHKLEKGLIMRPRRKLFAIDYIRETVDCYAYLLDKKLDENRSNELQWSGDVLCEYFTVVGAHPIVEVSRDRFFKIYKLNKSECSVPYPRPAELYNQIPSYDQLLSLARLRRSVRWYEDQPVEQSEIDAALRVALLSPSACNRQPFRFHFFTNKEMVQQVGSLPAGTAGWISNIPVLAVVVGELGAYCYERDRHTMFIDASLAVMSFVLALETRGLSSCIINWVDLPIKERRMAQLLNLRQDQRPLMCVALGYADKTGLVPYSEKLPLSEIRKYI